MDKDGLIVIIMVLIIVSIAMLVMPFSESISGAAIAIPLKDAEFCDDAIDDLVRLNKIKEEIPEIMENYDFLMRLNTAISQVSVCN